jgi:hypothetical protein
LDLIALGPREVPREKLARLARVALSGGAANRHEAALKSVAGLCTRSSRDNSRTQEYLRQLLADLIDPTPLKPDFALPALGEIDPLEVAGIPGVAGALGSLFANPIATLRLGENAAQWARLLGAVLVTNQAARSLNPEMISAILDVCRALPLDARPLELRLSESRLEVLAGESGVRKPDDGPPSGDQRSTTNGDAGGSTQPARLEQPPSIAAALGLLQRAVAALERDQEERRSALSAKIAALEGDIQRERAAYRDLEERHNRLNAEFLRTRDEARDLQSAAAASAAERDAARAEQDTLRRELDLVGGLGSTSVDAAKAEVRKSFMRLTLLPLQSVRVFAERLRVDTGAANPDLLIVPLRSIIQVLHQQGFATEADIPKL